MLLFEIWRYLVGRRRASFYETQDAMRQAIETAGPVDISWLTEEALLHIAETEPHTLRAEAAMHEIESRMRERIVAAARTPFMAR